MRWMNILLAVWIIAAPAAVYLAAAPKVSACSCARMLSPKEALERADAAFAGTVTEIADPKLRARIFSSADPVVVSFEVQRVWKGELGPYAAVSTARSSASCGYPHFAVGKTFVVFAAEDGGRLETGLCMGNFPLADEAEVLAELGEGMAPAQPEAAQGGGYAAPPAVFAVLAAAALAALLVLAWRQNAGRREKR